MSALGATGTAAQEVAFSLFSLFRLALTYLSVDRIAFQNKQTKNLFDSFYLCRRNQKFSIHKDRKRRLEPMETAATKLAF